MSVEVNPTQKPLPTPKGVFANTYEPIIPGIREAELFYGDTDMQLTDKGIEFQTDMLSAKYAIERELAKIKQNDPERAAKLKQVKNLTWVREARRRDLEFSTIKLRRERIMYPLTHGSGYAAQRATDLYIQAPLEEPQPTKLKIVDKAA